MFVAYETTYKKTSGTPMSQKETGTRQLHKENKHRMVEFQSSRRDVDPNEPWPPVVIYVLLWSVVSPQMESELCHVACFGQWDIRKWDVKWKLEVLAC